MSLDDDRERGEIVDVYIHLRSRQDNFLSQMSDTECQNFSECLRIILDEAMARDGKLPELPASPPYKRKRHVIIERVHLEYVGRLMSKHALDRSEIIRRIIDNAIGRREYAARALK